MSQSNYPWQKINIQEKHITLFFGVKKNPLIFLEEGLNFKEISHFGSYWHILTLFVMEEASSIHTLLAVVWHTVFTVQV